MNAAAIFPLSNPIQSYAWGSRTAIAEILGTAPSTEPQAELWMGAHPHAPSRVRASGREVPLDAWIARDPAAALGAELAARHGGSLPFLFKILAAELPLSIQAHPDAAQARAGFERESRAGIPLDAPQRCYRDPNPKPELVCAVTPFRALSRFRSPGEIATVFSALGGPMPASGDPRQLVAALLALPGDARSALLARAADWAKTEGAGHDGSAWVLALLEQHSEDIGTLAPFFLNVVELAPGEAMFLPPGELHAYLGGTALELMANSDNVLRGGLTSKHVDGDELLAVLADRSGPVERLLPRPLSEVESVYETPAPEFTLSRIDTRAAGAFEARADHGVEILLCLEGTCVVLQAPGPPLRLGRGSSAFVPAAAPAYRLIGAARLYRASPGSEPSSAS